MIELRRASAEAAIEGARQVARFVLRIANEPARRFKILWYFFAWVISLGFLVIGAGYLVKGSGAAVGRSLDLVQSVEGNLHVHGGLMVGTAVAVIYGLKDYRRFTRWALFSMFLYSLWVSILLFGEFGLGGASWGAPWFFVIPMFLTGGLIVLAPPLGLQGRRWGTEGSGSA